MPHIHTTHICMLIHIQKPHAHIDITYTCHTNTYTYRYNIPMSHAYTYHRHIKAHSIHRNTYVKIHAPYTTSYTHHTPTQVYNTYITYTYYMHKFITHTHICNVLAHKYIKEGNIANKRSFRSKPMVLVHTNRGWEDRNCRMITEQIEIAPSASPRMVYMHPQSQHASATESSQGC